MSTDTLFVFLIASTLLRRYKKYDIRITRKNLQRIEDCPSIDNV